MTVEIYSKPDCPLCDEAKEVLARVQRRVPFVLREVDITLDPQLYERHRYDIPVVLVNGRKAFKHHLDEALVEARLRREQPDGR
jgi:glutaredoxin